jgi:hypothetical protein
MAEAAIQAVGRRGQLVDRELRSGTFHQERVEDPEVGVASGAVRRAVLPRLGDVADQP